MSSYKRHPASYRDPAGFIFEHEGRTYRQVNQFYAADYELLVRGGLYDLLSKGKKLLSHTELNINFTGHPHWYKTLLPEQLNFITYPYEWCFSQWKDAALHTLELVKIAVGHGMILKDATPFNIQFINGVPVLIDSLSFEKYDAAKPWVAYRQFVECFIGPLLLARYKGPEMLKIFQLYPDGVPLRMVSKLLPLKSLFNVNIFLHIGLPGMIPTPKADAKTRKTAFTREKLLRIIENLSSFVNSLLLSPSATQWSHYYEVTIPGGEYAKTKLAIIEGWLKEIEVQTLLDIGTNTGVFALAAAKILKNCIAIDADAACIEKLYTDCKKNNTGNLIPLCLDITNPSPAIGWNNAERTGFSERVKTDLCMVLALVHHLAIGKNISFEQMAEAFSGFSPWLIIEFIPKNDPKVLLLLQERADIFSSYAETFFLEVFQNRFNVIRKEMIPGTERVIYLMKRR